ncbi:endonuclease [Cryobacterium glucosi]|uniref:Endonuclease n=1 Tax=Cryobacterium glucosi TaxID=1259175 RepID=A0ABY2IT76_9MICO|nr:endonuclease [Cryobacterium glucosi]TFC23382.1 endonuclease [Cryobacterium glucosi]
MATSTSRYSQLFVYIFDQHYVEGSEEVAFPRTDLAIAAAALEIELPLNLGDVIYTFRYRSEMPRSIADRAPEGKIWHVVTTSRAHYAFRAVFDMALEPRALLAVVKVPDSTPGIILQHVLNSEQALLAKVRYNRLIDLFTGIVCYSLQNHLRATILDGVQIETDEIYLGVDKHGVQYVIPVEAKGGSDKLSVVQINQDLALAKEKFPGLEVRLVGVQFFGDGDVYMFLFGENIVSQELEILDEKRFRLVDYGDISVEELASYRENLAR